MKSSNVLCLTLSNAPIAPGELMAILIGGMMTTRWLNHRLKLILSSLFSLSSLHLTFPSFLS